MAVGERRAGVLLRCVVFGTGAASATVGVEASISFLTRTGYPRVQVGLLGGSWWRTWSGFRSCGSGRVSCRRNFPILFRIVSSLLSLWLIVFGVDSFGGGSDWLPAVKPDSENDKEEDHGVIKEGVDVDVNVVGEQTNNLEEKDFPVEGPSTVLSLGQDGEKEEVVKDVEMVDENCEDRDGDDEVAEDGDEQGQWLFNGTNEFGKLFMRRCAAKHNEEFGRFDEKKEEEEEEVQIEEDEVAEEEEEDGDENENKFGLSPSHHDSLNKEGYTGNYLQSMEVNQMAFNPQDQLGRQSSSMDDMSLFNNTGKRVLEHNETHLMDNPNEPNKKLRISNSWDHNNKHMDFGSCMEQIQHVAETAKMLYEQKARELEYANMNQQIILSELQKRDSIIEHLHKTRFEELQKKDGEIYRLERELYLMETVLDGYRKALKETQRAFAEYREKAQLPEEPTYKDVGPGGLMLTAGEIEKIRKKQEEEFRMNCFIVEQKMKEVEEDWEGRFREYAEKVDFFKNKLTGLEANAKELIELCGNRKTKRIDEMGAEASEPQTEEVVTEEALWGPQSEEKMCDADEDEQPFAPQSEEKECEAEEPQSTPQPEVKEESEAEESLPNA
ncbi:Unknown protein [Striga hermonthica]|uniref:Uncharacterized protein n=1 Tax=Striga hermonthica TaxID=68872 RepID=A0A9N7N984_STRHE|nr:Unknown protein [Striga hermonthica]